MKGVLWLVCGFVFAIGLGVSGMTQPSKVVGFLNVVGGWDPSLAFVMVGAIGTHIVGTVVHRRMTKPIVADEFSVPNRTDISVRLVLGAAIFGLGWGLAGYCPGPAIVAGGANLAGSGTVNAGYFVVAMAAGMLLFRTIAPLEKVPEKRVAS